MAGTFLPYRSEIADPVSLTSKLVTLDTFNLQSSRTLYRAVERSIYGPGEELESLDGVLRSLHQEVAIGNSDLEMLKPLSSLN